MAEDLIYDCSVRDSLKNVQEFDGEITFSPLNFDKNDLQGDLNLHKLSNKKLLGLG